MQTLKRGLSKLNRKDESVELKRDRFVVAHFMLGNTWRWTPTDWEETFELAEDTSIDGFALNLGSEAWQYEQAHLAYSCLAARGPSKSTGRPFKAFLSLDMNVLSSGTEKHGMDLLEAVYEMMIQDGYLRWRGGPVLSTFGGHEARFGDWGWPGFIERLNERLDGKIMFIPAFFMPPKDFLTLPYVDGAFNWNSAWPQGDHSANVVEDEAFCEDVKPYMAAVSPLFFTHYGSSGEWAFNKNFIYRSDDLLYPWRWHALLSLPPNKSPNIIQIISWNDHGESHAIAPVRHNQPGSEEWTKDMPHEAFREMTRYFVRRWRDGLGEVEEFAPQSKGDLESTVKVWGWWRCHSKDLKASDDPVGEPVHADWARDLLNFLIVVPETSSPFHMVVHNGPNPQPHHLESGKANLITIPFVPGLVGFEVMEGSTDVIISASGKEIADQIQKYNFNMWGGSWEVKVGVRPS